MLLVSVIRWWAIVGFPIAVVFVVMCVCNCPHKKVATVTSWLHYIGHVTFQDGSHDGRSRCILFA